MVTKSFVPLFLLLFFVAKTTQNVTESRDMERIQNYQGFIVLQVTRSAGPTGPLKKATSLGLKAINFCSLNKVLA